MVGSATSGALHLLRLDASLLVTVIVGGAKGFANGLCASARFGSVGGVAIVGTAVYVSDTSNNRVRTVAAPGTINTVGRKPLIVHVGGWVGGWGRGRGRGKVGRVSCHVTCRCACVIVCGCGE